MTKKAIMTVLALGTLVSLTGVGVSSVLADDTSTFPPIISRIADKFNLQEDDVAAVFDAVREERRDEMMQNREENLSQAVSNGVISEDQKQALLNKWQEMRQEREQDRTELQAWFEEQGIDESALAQYSGFHHHGFKGMHMEN